MKLSRLTQAFSVLAILGGALAFPADGHARPSGNWCVLDDFDSLSGGTCEFINEEFEVLCFACSYGCPASSSHGYDYHVTTECVYRESSSECLNEFPGGPGAYCNGTYYDPIGG